MNVFYDQDAARCIVDATIARATQEEQCPPLLCNLESTELAVTAFENPKSFRLTRKDEPEHEAYFRVIGVLCSKVLPPFLTTPNIRSLHHLRNLRQFAKITGLGSNSFALSEDAMEIVINLFRGTLGNNSIVGIDAKMYEGDFAIDCHARYFTERDSAPQEKHIPFDALVDPHGILESVRGARLIHGPDNNVEYCEKILHPDGTMSYEALDPKRLKEGDIVEVTVAFTCFPVKERRYRFLTAMRAIALIDASVRSKSETKHEPVESLPAEERKTLKRKALFLTSTASSKKAKVEPSASSHLESAMMVESSSSDLTSM
ncbi:hypothetical protein CC2G_000237 [Coprinopsis cinerea AmutBmut pab1-1]|nr:hypothetical protein CC2G_000237 [Coprinopsis cinerea AmutBmut pab1-1]